MLRDLKKSCWAAVFVGMAALSGVLRPTHAQEEVAIKAGKIVPIVGDPIVDGVIVVREGKISAIGKDLAIPLDARVIDASGKVVMPGFIEAHSSRGVDRTNETNPNVPFVSVVDSIDPSHEYFEDCRRNGVTAVAIVPGHATMIGGQAAVVKTAGDYVDAMILKRTAGVKLSLRPASGKSRMSHLAALRKELAATQDYIAELNEKKQEGEEKSKAKEKEDKDGKSEEGEQQDEGKRPDEDAASSQKDEPDVKREAMVRLLKGELPAFIYCERAMDVSRAVELVREYKLKAILVLDRECYKAVDVVKKSGLPVILEPELVYWEYEQRTDEEHERILPKIYREAGVEVTFQTTGITGGSLFSAARLPSLLGTNFLWYQAATAVKYGTPRAEALEAITLRPAQVLGIDQFVGSLQIGKDADVVILSGDPLKVGTWVETVLVNGKVVYERDKDEKLKQLLAPKKES
jgi:imidazolonepropionase-like amidohydrolase